MNNVDFSFIERLHAQRMIERMPTDKCPKCGNHLSHCLDLSYDKIEMCMRCYAWRYELVS